MSKRIEKDGYIITVANKSVKIFYKEESILWTISLTRRRKTKKWCPLKVRQLYILTDKTLISYFSTMESIQHKLCNYEIDLPSEICDKMNAMVLMDQLNQ